MPETRLMNHSRPKILVVDDQEVNLELMEAHLVPEGSEVCFAGSGPEALDKLDSEQPDLVLLDIMMPEMDGNEVCRRLRSAPGHDTVPVVMITALEDEVDNRVKSIEAGADDFIEKPVVKRELLARVQSLIEKQQAYRALSQKNANLQAATQMSHDLRHMILHDIGTPISELDLALGLAMRREKDRKKAQLLQWMSLSTERLNRLTGDLLDLDRLEEGRLPLHRTVTDINALVRSELGHLRRHPDCLTRSILCSLAPGLPEAYVDANLLVRVLANLLNNALKYTPSDSSMQILTSASQDYVEVTVCDNGPGIPAEEREVIFDKYYQAENRHHPERKGQGLGLAFCKMVIDAHGGRIWVDGEQGACFHFTIPTEITGETSQ